MREEKQEKLERAVKKNLMTEKVAATSLPVTDCNPGVRAKSLKPQFIARDLVI